MSVVEEEIIEEVPEEVEALTQPMTQLLSGRFLSQARTKVASIRSAFGLPASTPVLDRVNRLLTTVRTRVKSIRGQVLEEVPEEVVEEVFPQTLEEGEEVEALV